MNVLLVVCVIISFNNVESVDQRVDPLVKINQGLVRGRWAIDGLYSYFLGIPYARVDLSYPFGAAEPPTHFGEEIFNAYDGSVICPQMIQNSNNRQFVRYKETVDCLRLNVYVPYEASYANPLPVLLWIHGGAFEAGYGTRYNPSDLVKKGIIIVTINYRLGPYGFICLDHPLVSGNRGLKDQYEALRWVNNNIAAFGGSPNDVTLAGQSAGSISTLLHLYSHKEKLFNQIIAQSGVPQSIGVFVDGDNEAAVKLAQYLNYNTTNTDLALEFLAQASHDLVTDAAIDLKLHLTACKEILYSGVDFIVESYPIELSNKDKIKGTPIMIGHTSKEAETMTYNVNNYFKTDPFVEHLNDNFHFDDEELAETAKLVRQFYIGEKTITSDVSSEIADFKSDLYLNHPVQETIMNLIDEYASPIYEYVFSYVDKAGAAPAGHSAEMPYLFAFTTQNERSQETKLIIDRITTLWANFVKYGNPTPEVTDLLKVIWEPVTINTRPYLDIDKELQLKSRVYRKRMAFWDLFYSVYGKKHKLSRECYMYAKFHGDRSSSLDVKT